MDATAVAQDWYPLEPDAEIAGGRGRREPPTWSTDSEVHGVRPGSPRTLCGLPAVDFVAAPQPDTFTASLGACPSCTRAISDA